MDTNIRSIALNRCVEEKSAITPRRMLIIESLFKQQKPISAYELKEYLNEIGEQLNIATIYRVLGFWCTLGLAHRISSINKFVSCSDPEEKHTHIINYCKICESTVESCHKKMGIDIASGAEFLGLTLATDIHLEVPVFCESCG
ncbi:MAG: transcriptional repressor [Pseudomonadota bacterium]|nr:transcriptional repressor [Pseudomonadota bacterium]